MLALPRTLVALAALIASPAAAALAAPSAVSAAASTVVRAPAPAPSVATAPSAMPAPAAEAAMPGVVVVDGFDSPDAWSAVPADGVEMKLSSDAGVKGRSLRVDFRFVKGGGYAVIHRKLDLDLPENYRFTFRLRGECQPNNLEFKLIDSTGANVWWCNRRDVHFPHDWKTVTVRRRHISFAWGPAGGGEIRHVAALEFAVTAGSGGTGTVWLDDLELTPMAIPSANPPRPVASASSERAGHAASLAVDGDSSSWWGSIVRDRFPWITLDLGEEREFGGLVVDWAPGWHAKFYAVDLSPDGASWRTVRTVAGGNGGRDYLYLPESEARYVRLRVFRGAAIGQVAVREISVEPLEWASSLETFYQAAAKDAPRGTYPRGISGEQSYWTVVGVSGGHEKGLLNEDGMLETFKAGWSVEPFLYADGRLVTWADVKSECRLERDDLPLPSVTWTAGDLTLRTSAFATGREDSSSLVATYRVHNGSAGRRHIKLFLALRPFQVNPPAQFLNTPGGSTAIRRIERAGRLVTVNGERGLASLTAPTGFGAATFDQGDVVADFIRHGRLPAAQRIDDPFAHASGALAYDLDLAAGADAQVALLVPQRRLPARPGAWAAAQAAAANVSEWRSQTMHEWMEREGRVEIVSPPSLEPALATLRAQLGWILINRDSAAIQPGSRSYDRSWIRDGALMSSALLRLGHPEEVREYIEWFARYQYPDGKVPCCVDYRGSDPVPEHDSDGEFIYLVAEYVRYTGDLALAGRVWPNVAGAVAYLDSLRHLRRTPEWDTAENEPYFGLLPPSISHEGYSAKPMHSYWDDLFALRGFKDAAYLAEVLGHGGERTAWSKIRDEFQADLAASIDAAMRAHHIDYMPGCADLGDLDATSTTIALDPVQAEDALPRAALEQTFERYWTFFTDRRDGRQPWEAFTPYEMRTIGAFVRLGWRERAGELLDFFMRYRRPPGWEQWAEVVWSDERAPHFIGDMPHTWVGSDFVRSVLDMFVYERERDSSLVIGAGLRLSWLAGPGVTVRDLRTRWGPLTYSLRGDGTRMTLRVEHGGLKVPAGGIALAAPGIDATWRATINGAPATIGETGELVVREAPATVVLER